MRNFMQKLVDNLYHRGLQMLFMGCVTGFLAGVAVTFYNILAGTGENFARTLYSLVRENPVFIPLLLLALALAAFVIGTVVALMPMVRGSGIPQTEGAARGELKYNWFSVLCVTFASSLACIFLGLSAGSEGPSIQIGGSCGYGSSRLFSKTDMLRRYQITGGACAGLAVAFNAPLTGMAFAFEETHKQFSPEVFICAFSSVVTGVITRNLLRSSFSMSTGATFTTYQFSDMPLSSYPYVAFGALICALLGIAFYFAALGLRKLFKKVTFLRGAGKMLFPFLIGGACSLITVHAIGGGHALIESLGTLGGVREMQPDSVFGSPLIVTLFIILAIKFLLSALNMGCGVPCGVFIPMLAIGASLGALMSAFCTQYLGMDRLYTDLMVMVGMAAFFTCVVRAPITGIVMVFELTWSFTALLPVVLGVAIGYMIGAVVKIDSIYEVFLQQFIKEQRADKPLQKLTIRLNVLPDSMVDGMIIKDVLWPVGTVVKEIDRRTVSILPEAGTELKEGDDVLIELVAPDAKDGERELRLLFGGRSDEVKGGR